LGEHVLRLMPINFGERAMIATCLAMIAPSVFLWIFQFVPGTLIPTNRSRLLNFAALFSKLAAIKAGRPIVVLASPGAVWAGGWKDFWIEPKWVTGRHFFVRGKLVMTAFF
jgi:hypothetical protein